MRIHLRTRPSKSGPVYYLDYTIDTKDGKKRRVRDQLDISFLLPAKQRKIEAHKQYHKRCYELGKGETGDREISVGDIMSEYLETYQKKDKRKVTNGCEAFLRVVDRDKLISKVNPNDCKKFKSYLQEKYSQDTVRSYFSSAKKVFIYAKDEGMLTSNPFTTVKNVSCLLYTSPSPRDQRGSRMPSSA